MQYSQTENFSQLVTVKNNLEEFTATRGTSEIQNTPSKFGSEN